MFLQVTCTIYQLFYHLGFKNAVSILINYQIANYQICFALRALWFVLEIIMAKNENNSHAFIRKMVENIKQTKDAQAPTDPKTNEVSSLPSYFTPDVRGSRVCAALSFCFSVLCRNSTRCVTSPCTLSCPRAPPTVWSPPKTQCCRHAFSLNLTRLVSSGFLFKKKCLRKQFSVFILQV